MLRIESRRWTASVVSWVTSLPIHLTTRSRRQLELTQLTFFLVPPRRERLSSGSEVCHARLHRARVSEGRGDAEMSDDCNPMNDRLSYGRGEQPAKFFEAQTAE
jgi:hypothetical protein